MVSLAVALWQSPFGMVFPGSRSLAVAFRHGLPGSRPSAWSLWQSLLGEPLTWSLWQSLFGMVILTVDFGMAFLTVVLS
jgi:hypothetical protein